MTQGCVTSYDAPPLYKYLILLRSYFLLSYDLYTRREVQRGRERAN